MEYNMCAEKVAEGVATCTDTEMGEFKRISMGAIRRMNGLSGAPCPTGNGLSA